MCIASMGCLDKVSRHGSKFSETFYNLRQWDIKIYARFRISKSVLKTVLIDITLAIKKKSNIEISREISDSI